MLIWWRNQIILCRLYPQKTPWLQLSESLAPFMQNQRNLALRQCITWISMPLLPAPLKRLVLGYQSWVRQSALWTVESSEVHQSIPIPHNHERTLRSGIVQVLCYQDHINFLMRHLMVSILPTCCIPNMLAPILVLQVV